MKKTIFLFAIVISSFQYSCCVEDASTCEILALADLIIPPVADLLDNNGVPLINPQTGQTIRAANEIYYNQRTGEYFNSDFPPTQGMLVGDIIEMGTNIFNVFSETDCESGANAPASITAPELTISGPFFNGTLPLSGMPTPPIGIDQREFTATIFELISPGYYNVDFNANAPRNINEHTYDNNFYFGSDGNFGKSSNDSTFQFLVTADKKSTQDLPRSNFNKNIAPSTINQMKQLNIYQFVDSGAISNWYEEKLRLSHINISN